MREILKIITLSSWKMQVELALNTAQLDLL